MERRIEDMTAVRRGGVGRLTVIRMNVEQLDLPPRSFDVVTMLEVLEHLHNPEAALRRVMEVARRFLIASVPSVCDDNPEHLRLFSVEELRQLATEAGCGRVTFEHVLNHRMMLCQT